MDNQYFFFFTGQCHSLYARLLLLSSAPVIANFNLWQKNIWFWQKEIITLILIGSGIFLSFNQTNEKPLNEIDVYTTKGKITLTIEKPNKTLEKNTKELNKTEFQIKEIIIQKEYYYNNLEPQPQLNLTSKLS